MRRLEPWFTFHAHIPPAQLRSLSPAQMIAHLKYWSQPQGGVQDAGI